MSDATKRDDGGKHAGEARTSPYPVSRLAPVFDLVDVAKRIQEADAVVGAVASAELGVIADQIRRLQDEAQRVLERTRRNLELHRARCSFARKPGGVYHLYRRPDGELWFSMIGPDEWGGTDASRVFAGTYRLELDQSWARLDEGAADASRAPNELVQRLLAPGTAEP
jgi:hypothetical protein